MKKNENNENLLWSFEFDFNWNVCVMFVSEFDLIKWIVLVCFLEIGATTSRLTIHPLTSNLQATIKNK